MPLSASTIARFFLALSEPEEGDALSNLKLQKLLYYGQGFSLAIRNRPLFTDDIEAWTHGPVVPVVYQEYKAYGSTTIPKPDDFDPHRYNESTKELLMDVYKAYGQFSAWKLRDMTHEEPPWKNTPVGQVIPHEAMLDYFLTQIEV